MNPRGGPSNWPLWEHQRRPEQGTRPEALEAWATGLPGAASDPQGSRIVDLPPPRGMTIWALGLLAPGGEITWSSALSRPEGALNGATAPSYTNWRKNLTRRLHPYQLEEEMRIHSTTWRAMQHPQTSGSTTARSEHSSADETEENDLNNKFMKMTEVS